MRAASNSIVNDIMSRLLLLITLFSIVWVGCTSERFANIERGSDVSFRQGYPEVRMMAVGLFDQDDMPGVSLHVDVVKGSLIYKSTDDVFSQLRSICRYRLSKIWTTMRCFCKIVWLP